MSSLRAICVAKLETTVQKTHKKGGQSQVSVFYSVGFLIHRLRVQARIGRLRDNKRQHNVSFVASQLDRHLFDHDTNRYEKMNNTQGVCLISLTPVV